MIYGGGGGSKIPNVPGTDIFKMRERERMNPEKCVWDPILLEMLGFHFLSSSGFG